MLDRAEPESRVRFLMGTALHSLPGGPGGRAVSEALLPAVASVREEGRGCGPMAGKPIFQVLPSLKLL